MAFIVFEGLDACGKSTLIEKVTQKLQSLQIDPLVLRDPGATELGERLRDLILSTKSEPPVAKAETLLYQAARVQMVEKKIKPALKEGRWVLCDRFYSSTVAFQSYARGLDRKDIDRLNEFVAREAQPDLFILIDISLEESQRRKTARAKNSGLKMDRMELEAQQFQQKVKQGYDEQASVDPKHWFVLDGTLSPDQLCEATVNELRRRHWLD